MAAAAVIAFGAVSLSAWGAANESTPAPAGPVSGTINGAGASTQQAATRAWVAGFVDANPGAVVNYDPTGPAQTTSRRSRWSTTCPA